MKQQRKIAIIQGKQIMVNQAMVNLIIVNTLTNFATMFIEASGFVVIF